MHSKFRSSLRCNLLGMLSQSCSVNQTGISGLSWTVVQSGSADLGGLKNSAVQLPVALFLPSPLLLLLTHFVESDDDSGLGTGEVSDALLSFCMNRRRYKY